MILEELIHFDQEKLKSASTPEQRSVLMEDFLTGFGTVSNEKLEFFIQLLKERQQEERPYPVSPLYLLIAGCAIVAAIALFLPFTGVPARITATLIIFSSSFAIIKRITNFKKNDRYKRLIRALEHYRTSKN